MSMGYSEQVPVSDALKPLVGSSMRLARLPAVARTTWQCRGIIPLARYKTSSSSALHGAAAQAVDGGAAAANAHLSATVKRIQQQLDMDDADLSKMLCRNRSIPSYNFADVDAKLRALDARLSLTQTDLKKMLIRFPKLLAADFEHSILPVLNNLERALDLDKCTLRKIAVKCPNVLTSGIQEKIIPMVKALKSRLQLDEPQMLRLVQAFPFVFCLDLEENLLPKLDKIQARLNMDAEELRKFVLHAPQVLSLTFEGNIEAKLQYFEELGLSEAQLKHQVSRNFTVLCASLTESIIPNVELWEKELPPDTTLQSIVKQYGLPFLCCGFKSRTKPRFERLHACGIPINSKIISGLLLSEAQFNLWLSRRMST